jgi:hypothetical protein
MRERLIVWLRWQVLGRERPEDARRAAEWACNVTARFVAAGGVVLATISATVVAAFDPDETEDVLDLLLDLLAEQSGPGDGARKDGGGEFPGPGANAVTCAVCLGAVDFASRGAIPDAPVFAATGAVGAAIDRAQLLAGRARGGEIVLDSEVRARAAPAFLFERTFGTGRLRGTTLDRRHPRRAPCREAVSRLGAPVLPPSHQSIFSEIERRLVGAMDSHARGGTEAGGIVVLRGPLGAGARGIAARLAERDQRTLWLDLPAVVGAMEPLGSLAGALRAATTRLAALRLPPEHAAVLAAVADGFAVTPAALGCALDALEAAVAHRRGALLLSADAVSAVDAPSLAALARVAARGRALLLARAAMDEPLPQVLAAQATEGAHLRSGVPAAHGDPPGPVHERVLPPLHTSDAIAIASALLGKETDEDVVRRVAVMGGDTPVGVEEAAKTLVACGDLVFEAGSWVWRRTEPDQPSAVNVEELLAERLSGCEEASVRVLECLAVVGDRQPLVIAQAVALADGLEPGTFARALATARREGFVTAEDPPALLPILLRKTLLDGMPTSRVAELHRYAAVARRAYAAAQGCTEGTGGARFAGAAVGAHAREGGMAAVAARELLEAARVAAEHGWREAAAQLARAAVDAHDDDDVRAAAARWLEGAGTVATPRSATMREGGASAANVAAASATAPAPSMAGELGAEASCSPASEPRYPGDRTAAMTKPPTTAPPPPPDNAPDAPRGTTPAHHGPVEVVCPAGKSTAPPETAWGRGAKAEADGPSAAPEVGGGARRVTVAALRAGDAASLEALADRARAAGRPNEATERVRAVASLMRGDTANALRILRRDRILDRDTGSAGASTRTALALGLALHEAGDFGGAVRASLAALASARRARDVRGEEAALRALARTFAALGRDDVAARLEGSTGAHRSATAAPRAPCPSAALQPPESSALGPVAPPEKVERPEGESVRDEP